MNANTIAPAAIAPAAIAPAAIAPGAVIKYKRDGRFTVVADLGEGRFEITTDKGKFAGKIRKVALDADTVIVEPAPAAEPVVDTPAEPVAEPVADTPAAPVAPAHTRDNCEDLDGCTAEHVATKRTRRGGATGPRPAATDLPDGWVTIGQLAAEINGRGMYRGSLDKLPSRFVYSRALRGSKTNPFPGERVGRGLAVELEAGLAWWAASQRRSA